MATKPNKGSRVTFKHKGDAAHYGVLTVVSVVDVYSSLSHPGPAFTTWVELRTEDGRTVERRLGEFSKTTRPVEEVTR